MYNNKPIHIMYHIIPEVFHKCMLFTKVIDVKEKSFTYILNLNINELTFIICKTMLEYDQPVVLRLLYFSRFSY